jgi:hypothetical protein
MDVYKHVGSGGFELGGGGEISSSVPTCNTIYDDIVYFLKKANMPDTDDAIGKRFARVAIVFMAFYLESLTKVLLEETIKRFDYKLNCNKNDIINILKKIYEFINNDKLSLDTGGIDDLFHILRSQLIAHPPDRSILWGSNVPEGKGLRENGKAFSYKKFKHFSNTWENFSKGDAQDVYNELKLFLSEYYNLISIHFPGCFLSYYFNLKEI